MLKNCAFSSLRPNGQVPLDDPQQVHGFLLAKVACAGRSSSSWLTHGSFWFCEDNNFPWNQNQNWLILTVAVVTVLTVTLIEPFSQDDLECLQLVNHQRSASTAVH